LGPSSRQVIVEHGQAARQDQVPAAGVPPDQGRPGCELSQEGSWQRSSGSRWAATLDAPAYPATATPSVRHHRLRRHRAAPRQPSTSRRCRDQRADLGHAEGHQRLGRFCALSRPPCRPRRGRFGRPGTPEPPLRG
jgi:hypothetical protein